MDLICSGLPSMKTRNKSNGSRLATADTNANLITHFQSLPAGKQTLHVFHPFRQLADMYFRHRGRPFPDQESILCCRVNIVLFVRVRFCVSILTEAFLNHSAASEHFPKAVN